MKAFVVYESHWGNTAAVAEAIAKGIGQDAVALTTDEATSDVIADADLLVAGSPVMAFSLPSERMRESIANGVGKAPAPPDLSHPLLKTWLDGLPRGHGVHASFETGIRWSPGGATGAIDRALEVAGWRRLTKGRRFVVTGSYGPLKDGELDRAWSWGNELAHAVRATLPAAVPA